MVSISIIPRGYSHYYHTSQIITVHLYQPTANMCFTPSLHQIHVPTYVTEIHRLIEKCNAWHHKKNRIYF